MITSDPRPSKGHPTPMGVSHLSLTEGASSVADEGEMWNGPHAIVRVLEALLDHPKPTIARVQGHVAGGGNGLLAACDLSVAVESAKLAFSEVRLGLAPAVISVVCLARMNPAVAGYVDQLRRGGPNALAATKELLSRVPTMPRGEAFAWTRDLSASLFSSEEAAGGVMAFLKRKPAPWVAAG